MDSAGFRVRAAQSFVDASHVAVAAQPFFLPAPNQQDATGQLTVKKENGTVKGFEYKCVCGHRNYFVCE